MGDYDPTLVDDGEDVDLGEDDDQESSENFILQKEHKSFYISYKKDLKGLLKSLVVFYVRVVIMI